MDKNELKKLLIERLSDKYLEIIRVDSKFLGPVEQEANAGEITIAWQRVDVKERVKITDAIKQVLNNHMLSLSPASEVQERVDGDFLVTYDGGNLWPFMSFDSEVADWKAELNKALNDIGYYHEPIDAVSSVIKKL